MKILKLKPIVLSMMMIAIVVITSCNQDKNELLSQPLEKEQSIITDYLLKQGYKKDRIYFEESNVLFSACEHNQYKHTIVEMLSMIEDTQKENTEFEVVTDELDSRAHVFKHKHQMPSIGTVENIVYQIDPSVTTEWRNAIYQGINTMNTLSIVNGVSRCAVNYVEETNLNNFYHTKFYEKELGLTNQGTIIGGQTILPGGTVSKFIELDKDNGDFSYNVKVHIVIHEIFHSLGITHTGDANQHAMLVGGTGFNDQHSIMGQGGNYTINPSVHDIKALKKLYPTWLRQPNLLHAYRSNTGKDVSFAYNNDAANHPYFWIKAVSYTQEKQQLTVKWYKVNDLTSKREDLIMKDVPASAKYIRVRAYNYKMDRYSNWSVYKQI